jgi:sec-independent protein translocase protein TatA
LIVAVEPHPDARPRYPTGMNGWFGPWELLILLAVVLLIFGPKRLPQLGRSLGQGARSFKDGIRGRHDKDELDDEVPALPPSPDVTPPREKETV